jgi:hypothetical protein
MGNNSSVFFPSTSLICKTQSQAPVYWVLHIDSHFQWVLSTLQCLHTERALQSHSITREGRNDLLHSRGRPWGESRESAT